MRHLGSLVFGLLSAPVIWVLSGVGLVRFSSGMARLETGDTILGFVVIAVVAGLLAALLLPRWSPIGTAVAGLFFMIMALWSLIDYGSMIDLLPRSFLGVRYALTAPAGAFATLIAVLLGATAFVPQRWRSPRVAARLPGGSSGQPGFPPYPAPPGQQFPSAAAMPPGQQFPSTPATPPGGQFPPGQFPPGQFPPGPPGYPPNYGPSVTPSYAQSAPPNLGPAVPPNYGPAGPTQQTPSAPPAPPVFSPLTPPAPAPRSGQPAGDETTQFSGRSDEPTQVSAGPDETTQFTGGPDDDDADGVTRRLGNR
ncbi:hypothetical protein ABNF97_07570 [Plantactinospora sp. B6F1]|uniref:hypothetical protein n=1 Tax=Plantactinospora sp. B6F1 TaxID=3158971 RepID=UPI0032D99190